MARGKNRVQFLGSQGTILSDKYADWDFLYDHSTAKSNLYNIGDRVVLPDGRVFRYGKAGANLTSMKYAVSGYNQLVAEYTSPSCVPTAAITVGAKSAAFTVTAQAIGVSRNGIIAEDELRGGYISFYTSSSDRPQRGIIGNSALAAAGTSITIYFDASIRAEIAASAKTEIMANPYSDVRCGYTSATCGKWCAYYGMPNVLATTGQYFWIQTWGAFRITPAASAFGEWEGERQMMFDQNGSIVPLTKWHTDIATESKLSYQLAGFLMERCAGTAGDSAPFINLQINP